MDNIKEDSLRYYTGETSAPYEEDECPFPRTKDDDKFDAHIVEKYGLATNNKQY